MVKKVESDLEAIVYFQMAKHIDSVLVYCKAFSIDPKALLSILFVERIQYQLPSIYANLRKIKCSFLNMLDIAQFKSEDEYKKPISDWLNCSRGFTHIKWHTARVAHNIINDQSIFKLSDLSSYRDDPDRAIKIMCIILMIHIESWKNSYPDIDKPEGVDILGTLFNISDLKSAFPHSHPKSGGSELDHICDGVYFKSIIFGDRVKMTYNSKAMTEFFRKIENEINCKSLKK